MYIHRIILRDVHNFDKLDVTLYDDLWQKPLNSVLLLGPNGSGKTTLLYTIAELWEMFLFWLRVKAYNQRSLMRTSSLRSKNLDNGLIAMELRDFPEPMIDIQEQDNGKVDAGKFPQSIWLFIATNEDYARYLPTQENVIGYFGTTAKKNTFVNTLDSYWNKKLMTHLESLQIGMNNVPLLPNMLFFDVNSRDVGEPPLGQTESKAESIYRWFVHYTRKNYDLETVMKNIKLRNPSTFYEIIKNVNQFYHNKKIIDFDENLRLVVQTEAPKSAIHYIEDLSSGEQQCLIMMVMIWRWMMPGGIVMIDEPDLYLHVSLQRHFIRQIEKIVHARGGQLIVTSHSEYIWDNFSESNRIHLGVEETVHE